MRRRHRSRSQDGISPEGAAKARPWRPKSTAISALQMATFLPLCEPRVDELTPRVLAAISFFAGFFASLAPAFAQHDLKVAPTRLSLAVRNEPPDELCRRFDATDTSPLATLSLHRTFHDDFDEHPLKGKWVPHYSGGAAWPDARYWGGDGSDFKRKDSWNGEQQIYVDPRYGGRANTPLGLDPFKFRDGILSIVANRPPPELDVMEGRGQEIGDMVMTTHWRIPATGIVQHCGFDFLVKDASSDFHDYGVLWT